MIYVKKDELPMMSHTAEVMHDRMCSEPDQWGPECSRAVDHIDDMGKSSTPMLVLTGEELDRNAANHLFHDVVKAELRNWVPDASQRLLSRAAAALGSYPGYPLITEQTDCGAEPHWHALVADWAAGIFVRRCITCARLYADGAADMLGD